MFSGEKRRKKFSPFIVSRAIFVRILFAVHGLTAVWRLYSVTGDGRYWYICLALAGLMAETVITFYKMRGHEWKWFCPSVFFYLLCLVPAIWFLELDQLNWRIKLQESINTTGQIGQVSAQINDTMDGLKGKIAGLGLEFKIPIRLTPDQWLRTLEQILLLFLILGRWLLPKGKLTHDQLSQLLLVYIGTAADIVEFFEAFKEDKVRFNRILCMIILAIWSWSLLQFTMVLTATKARKDQSGLLPKKFNARREPHTLGCCTPDVYGIVISIFMQDAPFLVLRLLLIFKYDVVSYTNMFFTCKNTLVILLLLYRLVVIQAEKRAQLRGDDDSEYMMSESSSRARLMVHSTSTDQYYNYRTKVNLREPEDDPDEPPVAYIVRRHMSNGDLREESSPLHQTSDEVIEKSDPVADEEETTENHLNDHDVDDDFKLDLDIGNFDSLTKKRPITNCDNDGLDDDELPEKCGSGKLYLDMGDVSVSDVSL